jgi:hypothetical protein
MAWPVVVEAGSGSSSQTVNVSGRGAMVKPTERLSEQRQTAALPPPNGRRLMWKHAWRVDRDGLAFFFTHDNQSCLTNCSRSR